MACWMSFGAGQSVWQGCITIAVTITRASSHASTAIASVSLSYSAYCQDDFSTLHFDVRDCDSVPSSAVKISNRTDAPALRVCVVVNGRDRSIMTVDVVPVRALRTLRMISVLGFNNDGQF